MITEYIHISIFCIANKKCTMLTKQLPVKSTTVFIKPAWQRLTFVL